MVFTDLDKYKIPVFGNREFRGDCPLETPEQISALAMLTSKYPELSKIAVHIRNEGQRTKCQGAQHKREGMNTGAADIMIPTCPPILIELKRRDHTKSSISKDQIAYLVRSARMGAFACVALGSAGFMEAIEAWHTANRK